MDSDIKWFIQTCHQYQLHSIQKTVIPLVIPHISTLFAKVHIDTKYMPWSGRYHYILHAWYALIGWPKWHIVKSETGKAIRKFIHKEILCHWGAVSEIITDNGTAFVVAMKYLTKIYRIWHIQISAYNSQANRIIKCRHLDMQKALLKTCEREAVK